MNQQQTIARTLEWLNISAHIQQCAFEQYKTIPSQSQGVYVIVNATTTIYVGKGQIRSRQHKHMDKALAIGQARDTQGWAWLRLNTTIDIVNWHIYYVQLPSQTQRVAVEGSLIHLLQPLANDETFLDRANFNNLFD